MILLENLVLLVSSPWIYLLIVWDMVWRGIALWKSGRNNHLIWFVFLFIVNSMGILPIVYLLIHSKKRKNRKK